MFDLGVHVNKGRTKLFVLSFSIGTFITGGALGELPPDGGAEVQVSDEAREQFQVGVALLQDPDGAKYEEAYRAFLTAYGLSPSWKILGNLGLCALKLERFDDGIEAFSRYLKYGGDELRDEERDQFERDLRVMKATSGTLVIQASGGKQVRDTRARAVGGPITNVYDVPKEGFLEVVVASGKHTLVVEADGLRVEKQVSVDSGSRLEVDLELRPEEPVPAAGVVVPAATPSAEAPPPEPKSSPRPLETAGWVVGGVGVASLVGAGVTMALGFGLRGKLNDDCPDKQCSFENDEQRDSYEQDLDRLKLYGGLTTGLAIGGGILAAAGVTMIVIGGNGRSRENATLSLTPSLVPTFAGLSARGSF